MCYEPGNAPNNSSFNDRSIYARLEARGTNSKAAVDGGHNFVRRALN